MSELKEKTVFTSKYKTKGGILFEQIYNPERNLSSFVGWNRETQETIPRDELNEDFQKILPIQDELLTKGAVLLPSKPIDYETEENLELEIECFIKTWLDISEEHLQQATWYVMLSWVTDNLHTIPYLRALGDYGTGKTRYLDVIGGICYKPMYVGGAVSSAPIYRTIDKWRGTLILDEFTLKQTDETQDLIQILNCGFQRGKPVLRCKEGNYEVLAFDPFGAKIIATRTKFYDKALESRCITETMQLTDRNDIPVEFTDQFYIKRNELQNKLLMYRFKNWDQIKPDDSINIDFGNILPRIKQSFAPFTVLFQYDTNKLNSFFNYTKQYNNKLIMENAESFDGQIFNAYLRLLEEHNQMQQTLDDYHKPTITASNIRDVLINDGWKDTLTSAKIGRRLKILGFESNPKLVSGKTVRVLEISENKLLRLKRRYDITAITDITAHTEQIKNNNNHNNKECEDV